MVKKGKLPKVGRDTLLLVAGLAGVFHETVIASSERPTLLFLFATMIGLPAYLRSDEKKAQQEADKKGTAT